MPENYVNVEFTLKNIGLKNNNFSKTRTTTTKVTQCKIPQNWLLNCGIHYIQ